MTEEKNPVFNFKIPKTPPLVTQLIDETLLKTPVPQAASTANRDNNKLLSPLPKPVINSPPADEKYMSDILKDIETIKEQMYGRVYERNPQERTDQIRQSVESQTNSSLGKLKVEDLLEQVYSQDYKKNPEERTDRVRQSVESETNSSLGILNQEDLKELDSRHSILQCSEYDINRDLSQRFAKELGRPSLDLQLRKTDTDLLSSSDEVKMFCSKEHNSLPKSNNQDSIKMSMSSFMRKGSCPLGSLGDDNEHERPTFGRLINSPEKKKSFPIRSLVGGKQTKFELDEIPTKDTDTLQNIPTSDLVHHIGSENGRDEFSSSSVSSVASVSQIAEILSNMSSDVTPRTLVNNIMSKAKSKFNTEENQSKETKYTYDLQTRFSDFCNNFKTKPCVTVEDHENICPTTPKSSQLPRVNRTRIIKPLQLSEQPNYSGDKINSSVYEFDKSTQYSSSINSSFDVSDLRISSSDLSKDLWKKMFKSKVERSESSESSTLKSSTTTGNTIVDGKDNINQVLNRLNDDQNDFSAEDENDTSELNVCIGTTINMDFDVFNKTENAQICYIWSHVYVNDEVSADAASVQLVDNEMILEPNSNFTIPITVTPWVEGSITIKVNVQRVNTVTKETILDTVTGKLIGNFPDVRCDSVIIFDPLHEGCTTQQSMVLYNASKCEVPITLKILKESKKDYVFSFDGQDAVDILILPGHEIKQQINCFGVPVDNITEVKSSIEMSLAIGVDDKSADMLTVPITTVIVPCHLYIDQHELILQAGVKNQVLIQNRSSITMKMSVIPPAGVRVKPNTLQLDPSQKFSLFVAFESKNTKGNLREGSSIAIQILPNGKTYQLKLKTRQECYPLPAPSLNEGQTPLSSRTPSSMSPSSSVGSADESMQLECTQTMLIWASYPVHSKTVKTCVLRNRSMHREKLLISIVGSNNCFKLVKDQKKLEDQLQLSLRPMESTSLTVVMIPTHSGAFSSSLCITRINSTTEKKVVIASLWFRGKAKLIPQGVSRDPEQRMWIYLDKNTLATTFTMKNVGDASAFVKISQGMEATGISISPPECLILPGTSVRVEISLTTTADRLEYLLSQPGDSAVSVTKLTLTLGDESTRHRLNRLYRKLRSTEQGIDALWNSRLMVLNGLFSDKDMDGIRILRDPISSLETLWHEGIREWNIGVLVERSLLESMQLDSSVEFVDLENTILEHTVFSPPPVMYKVTPSTLKFSSNNCKQELTLQNNTAATVTFECQSPATLSIVPDKGILSTLSSAKVHVHWIEPGRPISEYKIIVIFGDKEKIEVPFVLEENTNPTLVVGGSKPFNLGVYSDEYSVIFPTTTVGGKSMFRVRLFNPNQVTAVVKLEEITGPFTLGIPEFILKGLWYMNLRLVFRPTSSGEHEGTLTLNVNDETKLVYTLYGKGVDY